MMMARPIVRLRGGAAPRTTKVEVGIDAPTAALHALIRSIDGMATTDDALSIEAVTAGRGGQVAICDSSGFPLFVLTLRAEL